MTLAMAKHEAMVEKVSGSAKKRLYDSVDWVCLNMAIFGSIFLNFLYQVFLQDIMALFFTQVIRIMDQAHVEVTFVRFIFFALFDEHVGQQNVTD